MTDTKKEILNIFQEEDRSELLPYTKEWSAENLYCVLYYNFVDGSLSHLERQQRDIDAWSFEEATSKCIDIINYACDEFEISVEEFFEKYTVFEEITEIFEFVKNLMIK